ncbi:MAG: pyridoxal-phosphate dependent enzyme [Planctomycetota bacterium]|nr:pyridoxal-phosphate dependent enzyme [Planctomycetota bacterium]
MIGSLHETAVADGDAMRRTAAHFRERGIALPTFAQLADPRTIPESVRAGLADVDPDAPHPLNLFRVHWFNGSDRRSQVDVPEHVVLPEALTGVAAPIVVLLGDRFPLIRAHKVLAAYACLVSRLVTGRFDPATQRAIWPSTGNYCRGGVAIARILGCRGVAVLPEGMSAERFRWLEEWVSDPHDVVRTPGSESNVKEIYDECDRLAADPANVVLNQFSEFGNHLAHRLCTARAVESVAESIEHGGLGLAAFVSASGSAGTLGAGDALKERFGTKIVAVEPLECPTLLYNGFGEHNIQGIGDKHVPLIHNVTNTDVVTAVSDKSTDALNVLFNTETGRAFLAEEAGVPAPAIEHLADFGLSSICNVLASIQVAKQLDLGPAKAVLTVATDGAELYLSEKEKVLARDFPDGFDRDAARRVFAEHLTGVATDHLLELSPADRDRIFNLGYYTWVEQRGVSLEDFERRRDQGFWRGLVDLLGAWDERIEELNRAAGVSA